MSKTYILQVLNLETVKDRDLIDRLAILKHRRLASSFIKAALREKIAREKESDEG